MLTLGIFDNDPMLYRFEGELFVGPGLGFFGSRLLCKLWVSADEIFIDAPKHLVSGKSVDKLLKQRLKRDSVDLHYPARLWLMRIGVRILTDALPANHIAVFIPDPLAEPRAIFARLDELGWGVKSASLQGVTASVTGR